METYIYIYIYSYGNIKNMYDLSSFLFYWVVVKLLTPIGLPRTPPFPSPASAKVTCLGAKQLERKHIFDDFL